MFIKLCGKMLIRKELDVTRELFNRRSVSVKTAGQDGLVLEKTLIPIHCNKIRDLYDEIITLRTAQSVGSDVIKL